MAYKTIQKKITLPFIYILFSSINKSQNKKWNNLIITLTALWLQWDTDMKIEGGSINKERSWQNKKLIIREIKRIEKTQAEKKQKE